ncbi:protein EFFECTOR OF TRANSCRIPTION 2-like [Diospyros lotus]|uniref:protein EFFECTOR OF TRANSCRIPTION 2-like n=1 Tax=Diospyros lotus TaxID=55363 RepID=UPI00225886C5|nr:protein EFFECTOR OF TRANSCRIPTION 2-like [Diospyros lotus]
MGAAKDGVVSTNKPRLKREDCKRTKHDSVFSQWKVLVGPSDWEDHFTGKEGAQRYRVQNLPNCASCSGLYELGVVVPHNRKLDTNNIVPVYLGQADNVRTRLQCYGRGGSHLENDKSNGKPNDPVKQPSPGLFTEIFSRACSVVYRWAPMKDKRDAERIEAQLLDAFDYAWNKENNDARRPTDIYQKLDQITLRYGLFSAIAKKLESFHHQKEKGIRIEACKPFQSENGYCDQSDSLLSRIVKVSRSHPRSVSQGHGSDWDHSTPRICGVALGQGSVCRRLPVEGRRRCAEHKGMKINGSTLKLIERESLICDGYSASSFSCDTLKPQMVVGFCPIGSPVQTLPVAIPTFGKDSVPICGLSLGDGTICKRQPVRGRKRCEEHKGRRIASTMSKLRTESE